MQNLHRANKAQSLWCRKKRADGLVVLKVEGQYTANRRSVRTWCSFCRKQRKASEDPQHRHRLQQRRSGRRAPTPAKKRQSDSAAVPVTKRRKGRIDVQSKATRPSPI
ncbi:hypothetical protein DIPPA_11456 [Diplonema papillatum]|nr:hypothetical protein DIPPA_11456 [Diplonema papillatum]